MSITFLLLFYHCFLKHEKKYTCMVRKWSPGHSKTYFILGRTFITLNFQTKLIFLSGFRLNKMHYLVFFWNVQDFLKSFVVISHTIVQVMLKIQISYYMHLGLCIYQDIDL